MGENIHMFLLFTDTSQKSHTPLNAYISLTSTQSRGHSQLQERAGNVVLFLGAISSAKILNFFLFICFFG